MGDSQKPDECVAHAQALYWVARVHSGEYTDDDRRALNAWLGLSEVNRRTYEQVLGTWDGMDFLKSAVIPEMREARACTQRRQYRFIPAAMAAALALVLLAAGSWLYIPRDLATTYASVPMEQKEIRLPDGSLVQLNVDSEIKAIYSGKSRAVHLLRGEALFSIAEGDARPFEVLAGNGQIRDIGTRFGVRINDDATSVFVLSGLVDVSVERHGDTHRLGAGEGLDYTPAGRVSPVRNIDAAALSAWSEGSLVLNGVTLQELADEVARYNRVKIQIIDSTLNEYRISGTFSIHGTEDIFDAVERMLPVTVVKENTRILLLRRPDKHG